MADSNDWKYAFIKQSETIRHSTPKSVKLSKENVDKDIMSDVYHAHLREVSESNVGVIGSLRKPLSQLPANRHSAITDSSSEHSNEMPKLFEIEADTAKGNAFMMSKMSEFTGRNGYGASAMVNSFMPSSSRLSRASLPYYTPKPAIDFDPLMYGYIPKVLKKKMGDVCNFCKNNGEDAIFYKSHLLKDVFGRVVCPVLRQYNCPICKSGGGDKAHTINYCPLKNRLP